MAALADGEDRAVQRVESAHLHTLRAGDGDAVEKRAIRGRDGAIHQACAAPKWQAERIPTAGNSIQALCHVSM